MKQSLIFKKVWIMAVLSGAVPVGVQAQIEPFVYGQVTVDDNIFRAQTDQQSDTLTTLGAGVNSTFNVGRQEIHADGRAATVMYSDNDYLDYVELYGLGRWNWEFGDRWQGNMLARYDRALASFDQVVTGTKDPKTAVTTSLTAGYELTPRWQLLGFAQAAKTRVDNRQNLDLDTVSGAAEVRYATGARTKIGARYLSTSGDYLYPVEVDGQFASNDYTEKNLSGTFYWAGSGKSELSFRIGRTERVMDELTERNFEGRTMRLTYDWEFTGKSKILASVWRDTSDNDEVSGYVVSQGIRLEPVIPITGKVSVRVSFLRENIDYEGDAGHIVSGGALRTDKDRAYGAALNYQMLRNLTIDAGYRYYDRESNLLSAVYQYSAYDIGVRYVLR